MAAGHLWFAKIVGSIIEQFNSILGLILYFWAFAIKQLVLDQNSK